MGLFFERTGQCIIGLFITLIAVMFKFKSSDFENFKDILSSAINLSAITLGFLATSMSMLISLTNDDIIARLKKYNLYGLLIKYLKSSIYWSLSIAVISSIGLFFNKGNAFSNYYFYCWIFLCSVGILSIIRVIRILMKILDKMIDEK